MCPVWRRGEVCKHAGRATVPIIRFVTCVGLTLSQLAAVSSRNEGDWPQCRCSPSTPVAPPSTRVLCFLSAPLSTVNSQKLNEVIPPTQGCRHLAFIFAGGCEQRAKISEHVEANQTCHLLPCAYRTQRENLMPPPDHKLWKRSGSLNSTSTAAGFLSLPLLVTPPPLPTLPRQALNL